MRMRSQFNEVDSRRGSGYPERLQLCGLEGDQGGISPPGFPSISLPYTVVVSWGTGLEFVQRFLEVSYNHGGHLRGFSRLRPRAVPMEPHLQCRAEASFT